VTANAPRYFFDISASRESVVTARHLDDLRSLFTDMSLYSIKEEIVAVDLAEQTIEVE
jgi:hypothetical protein